MPPHDAGAPTAPASSDASEPPLTALIVDDEPAAREYLAELLADHPEIQLLDAIGDPVDALAAVLRLRPALLFLDIQMPRLTGFDVLAALGDAVPPAVVFVTAYDEFAIRAFDADAADYLLKPFDQARFGKTITRAVRRARGPAAATAPHAPAEGTLAALGQLAGRAAPLLRHLPVPVGHRIVLQRVDAVSWFEADGKYVRVHAGGTPHRIRHTMGALERRLDPERFVRVSRSAIVNVEHVQYLEPWSHGEYVFVLRDGARVAGTHGYRTAVDRMLNGGGEPTGP
jgi:two-component system LytT family response regulator